MRPPSKAQIDKWNVEAHAQGWEFESQGSPGRGRFRHLTDGEDQPCGNTQEFQYTAMRNGQVQCDRCESTEAKWQREADKQGWDLVLKLSPGRARYKHRETPEGLPCGNEQASESGGMREGSVRCQDCQNPLAGWEQDAIAKGWRFLRKIAEGQGEYEHQRKDDGTACGHVQPVFAVQMRHGVVRCQGCQNPHQAWAAAADDRGWEMIQPTTKGSAEYRHRVKADGTPCGHVQEAQASNMAKGAVSCGECESPLVSWAAEAKDHGWELLHQEDDHNGYYRHLFKPDRTPCGAERKAQATHMRRGNVRCRACYRPSRVPSSASGARSRGDQASWEEEARTRRWQLVRLLGSGKGEYRHLKRDDGSTCGHLQKTAISTMRRRGMFCDDCLKFKWASEADTHGWKFLEQVDGSSARYEHLALSPEGTPCGEVKLAQLAQMRAGTVRCKKCQNPESDWKAIALSNGWEYLGRAAAGRAKYRHRESAPGVPCDHVQTISLAAMARCAVRCGKCQDPAHAWDANAKKHDWTLVRRKGRHRGIYRHLLVIDGETCDHEQEIAAGAMATGSVRCDKCENHLDRWAREADALGWDCLGQVDSARGQYRHRFKADGSPCGHEDTYQASQFRAGTIRCGGCQNPALRWAAEAPKKGWGFLEKVDSVRGLYRHLVDANGDLCGNVQPVIAASMRLGQVRCSGCQDYQKIWEVEAQENGWEFLERTSTGKASYRHLLQPDKQPCGHVQEVHIVQMRRKSVCCDLCGDPNVSLLHQLVDAHLADLEVNGVAACRREARFGSSPMPGRRDRRPVVDFLVPSCQPNLIVEIDGSQHFLRAFRGSESDLRIQITRDVFVDGLAMAQGLAILRFGSWEDETEAILTIQRRIEGEGPLTRLAEDMDFEFQAVHPNFHAWRAEAKLQFEAIYGIVWGTCQAQGSAAGEHIASQKALL